MAARPPRSNRHRPNSAVAAAVRHEEHLLGKVLGGAGVAPLQREAGQRAQVIYAEEMPVESQPPGGGIGGSGSIGGLEDCEITVGRGTTTVRAELPDQAALLGFLHRIAGLGLEVGTCTRWTRRQNDDRAQPADPAVVFGNDRHDTHPLASKAGTCT